MYKNSPFTIINNSEYNTVISSKQRIMIYTEHERLERLVMHADYLRSVEDLKVVAALAEANKEYMILEYLLNNTALKSLEIQCSKSHDNESVAKFIQLIANYLSTSKTVKKFILGDNIVLSIDQQTAEILANGINGSHLEFLGLINIHDMVLFDKLSTNSTIQRLYLRSSYGFGIGNIFDKSLGSNLRQLQMSFMNVDDSVVVPIINILRSSTNLEVIELEHFATKNLSKICDAIAANRSLKTLIIQNTPLCIGNEGAQRVCSAVKHHPTIDSLIINGIWRGSLKQIADDLLENNENNRMQSLTINQSKDGAKGSDVFLDLEEIKYFAEKLAINTTLKHLFLGNFCVHRKGVNDPTFLNALKSNKTLLTLDVRPKSMIYPKGIIELLGHNSTLTTLVVREIFVRDPMTTFYKAIMHNESLTSLDISDMTYEENETRLVQFINDIITNNTTLKELKCSGIAAKRKKFPALTIQNTLPSLKNNHTLTSLDIFWHPSVPTESDLKIIADVFSSNRTLVKFTSQNIERRDIEPYMRNNREYRVDAVVLWHNIVRAEEKVFPTEIWRIILQQVTVFSLVMEVTANKK